MPDLKDTVPEYAVVSEQLHKLWTWAVGLKGYDKKAWQSFEQALLALAKRAAPVRPTDDELEIAKLEDALDHIRAVCECPQMVSFTIDLAYVARCARGALKDAKPWPERATRR